MLSKVVPVHKVLQLSVSNHPYHDSHGIFWCSGVLSYPSCEALDPSRIRMMPDSVKHLGTGTSRGALGRANLVRGSSGSLGSSGGVHRWGLGGGKGGGDSASGVGGRRCKVVAPIKMTFKIYMTCVVPISAFFASSLWYVVSLVRFGNTAYLYISVAFIQMLKALMPVATFLVAVLWGTDVLRCDVFLNMVLISVGVAISSYGEIHFNMMGTLYQVMGIVAEALRLVLTQVLLQKKGLTLNPITTLYYIAPCSFVFLFIPWYILESPAIEVAQIQFNFWIFFSNALSALALNISTFLVIGRTGAVTIRVAGVMKDWILIALSTIIFPESVITGLNITGYAIALCGVVVYNYLKMKDARASQLPSGNSPDKPVQELKTEKSCDLYTRDDIDKKSSINVGRSRWNVTAPDSHMDEEAPLIPSSHFGKSQLQ
ncbi:hypothetical protein TIFTF001_021352 [Ficus carica]|uniref:Sugar phosphate transporter domain-containing protein n=1 Tax=Ficus carica TaxID=3494 RepID=A0AA88AYS6_FICCA|nr:hypothetical protein TIFTF001_021352 [Ficus carica]